MFDSKKIAVIEQKLQGVTQLLWLMTRDNGGNKFFTNDELDSVPQTAQLKFQNINNGLEIIAKTAAPQQVEPDNLIAKENGAVD